MSAGDSHIWPVLILSFFSYPAFEQSAYKKYILSFSSICDQLNNLVLIFDSNVNG